MNIGKKNRNFESLLEVFTFFEGMSMQLEKYPLTKNKALENIRCYNDVNTLKKHKQYLEVMAMMDKETKNGKNVLQFAHGQFTMLDLDPSYLEGQLRLHHEGFTYKAEKSHKYMCDCNSADAACTNWHIITIPL